MLLELDIPSLSVAKVVTFTVVGASVELASRVVDKELLLPALATVVDLVILLKTMPLCGTARDGATA